MAFIIAACGSGEPTTVPPTRPPTAIPPTPTPRSTPLPEVPDVPQLGDSRRPIELVFVLPGSANETRASAARTDLETYFNSQGLTVDVQFVENDAQAFQAVCANGVEGNPAAAWVSAFTLAAVQQQCGGVPALAVTRGQRTRATIGTSVNLIARADITAISALAGQVFCRIDGQNFGSWILPRLLMQSEGLNPLTDLTAIVDYADNLEMLRAVYEGECAAAAIPAEEFDELVDELADTLDTAEQPVSSSDIEQAITILMPAGETEVPDDLENWAGYAANTVPYEGLVFPPNTVLPANLRALITETLIDFSEGRDSAELLTDLLDASGIIPVDSADYEIFNTLLNRARWDMTYAVQPQ